VFALAVTLYQFLLVLKLLAVLGFAGGIVGAFVSNEPLDRKRAAHHVASPSLLVVWVTGYLLLHLSGGSPMELWTLGGLVLSLLANVLLGMCVATGRRGLGPFLGVAAPVICAVFLMVLRPTWAQVLH
jgi:hypothetical protein